jgi:hypothetical protein
MLYLIGKEFYPIKVALFTSKSRYAISAVVLEKSELKYYILDVLEDRLSYQSIVTNLNKFKTEYQFNQVVSNKNNAVFKKLNPMLENLSLYPYEFIAEDSIVNFMALLNDKKVEIVEKIKADFNNQLSNYDETNNQIASINAIMIAIDYSNKPTKRHAPISSMVY